MDNQQTEPRPNVSAVSRTSQETPISLDGAIEQLRTEVLAPVLSVLVSALVEAGKTLKSAWQVQLDKMMVVGRYCRMHGGRHVAAKNAELIIVNRELARRGWYFTQGMLEGDFPVVLELIRSSQIEDLETKLEQVAQKRVDIAIERAKQKWPDRAAILEQLLFAHDNGLYSLSVPCALAQADGMSLRIFGEYTIFKSRFHRDAPDIVGGPEDDIISQFSDLISRLRLGPAEIVNAVIYSTHPKDRERASYWFNARELDPSVSPLNRHAVMHGEDVGYSTLANSLRAIAIIDYLCELDDFLGD